MSLRRLLMMSASLAVFTATAQACPEHGTKSAAQLKPSTAKASALLAWKPRAWAPPVASASSGLRVAIDPVDGTLSMPAPGELETSAGVGEEDMRPVSVTRRANGSGRAQLDERWESHAMATMGPDGKPRWTCVDGKAGAERFLKNPVVPAAAPVSKASIGEVK